MARIIEYIKIALMNIRGNKARSFLTMLGIIIGISSVILIVSAGNGFKVGISGQLDALVGGFIQIYADVPANEADAILFNDDDIDAIYEKVPHVKGQQIFGRWVQTEVRRPQRGRLASRQRSETNPYSSITVHRF